MTAQADEIDFLAWTHQQSVFLRQGRFGEIDVEQLADELEDLGTEQKLALQSMFRRILMHLLKLQLSPAPQPRLKWIEEVIEYRDQAQARIDATPSLKHHALDLFAKAWLQARRSAQISFEIHNESVRLLDTFPYSMEQVLDPDYFLNARKGESR